MKHNHIKPILIVAIIAAMGAIFMLLWNSIIPYVVGWRSLSYLEAVGLSVFLKFIIRTIVGFFKQQNSNYKERNNIREQVSNMSKEQKKRYIREYIADKRKNVEK